MYTDKELETFHEKLAKAVISRNELKQQYPGPSWGEWGLWYPDGSVILGIPESEARRIGTSYRKQTSQRVLLIDENHMLHEVDDAT